MLQPQSSRAAGEAMRDLTAPEPQKKGRRQPRVTVQPEAMSAAGRYVVLTALCVLCYCNSLRGELVHDDVWAIINNPDVRPGSSLINIFSNDFWGKMMADNTSHKSYRPLCILSFKLNILLGGMTPLYFHMVNVCFHCAVTCLLMHTCKSCVFEDSRLAFITALLFAVHPVHTEAVSGVVGRADVLACLLFLLTFLSYVRSVGVCVSEDSLPSTMSACSLIVSLLLGTCAMLIKETGITVFGVCVLYDALVLCCKPLINHLYSSRPGNLLYICSPFVKRACLISGYVVLIMSVRLWLMGGSMPLFSEQDNPASFSPHLLTRILTYSYLLSFNAGLLLAPIVLCYDWQVGSIPLVESLSDFRNVAAMLLAIVMVALCLHCVFSLQRQESREVLVGVLFLVFPFIPASNLFFRVGFVVAERVLYMPRSGIQTLPHNAKAHYNYANFLKDSGRHEEAIHHYTTALRLYPRHASAMNNLGTLTHCSEEAEHFYRKALDTNPQHNRALFNLGNLLKSQGKTKEAEVLLMDSINFGAHFADAYSSLASLYAEQKRFPEANEVYLKGIENCPDNSDLHNNYGVFLVDTGEGALAEAHYLQAVRLKPAHYVAMVNLGRLLRSSNENEAAESWYKRALQITRKVDILTPLGALYYNTGRFEEALQVYREAAALQPDNTDIWLALAQVLAMVSHTIEAEKMTLDIISREGSCIECYRLLSAIYSKRGNFTEALDALDRALQQNPSDLTVRAELYFSKGNQLREMNQLDRAFEGDYAAARMYYQRALLLNPGSKLLKENLAKLDRLERKLTVEA
ncbi:protein O-mannosyl-transferase TMTC1 isoform X3 [Hippoglossus stenolepis]|uniref:protein O-mannosyl-transferase TMTC1 isoform X3 n=1 Tax=Hippoglossus stenolepis TaxID=195615 RepID=UPI001FAFCA2D|nr:protein O-mannosyl-transferase TMTC1 isoform X3 [Hippoglossus stenolepis]